MGNIAEFKSWKRFEILEILDREQCEIAIMGDVFDLGRIFYRAAIDGDEQAAAVRNDMRVGQDFVFPDDESSADAAAETAGIPWGLVIRDLSGHLDAQDGAINIRGQGLGHERRSAGEEKKIEDSVHRCWPRL